MLLRTILFFTFSIAVARADVAIDPKLGYRSQAAGGAEPSGPLKIGSSVLNNGRFEARLRVTTADPKTAATMNEIELANIKNLYGDRRTPYAGEVTRVIKCDRKYLPREFQLEVDGTRVTGLVGGVSPRNVFGACSSDQFSHWGAYFSFYEPIGKKVIQVRLFDSRPGKKATSAEIEAEAAHLLTRSP